MNVDTKRLNGQYFTKGNCFQLHPFREWFEAIPNHDSIVLTEPFAGRGDIPRLMTDAGYTNEWELFDLFPQDEATGQRDSIADCPSGVCIVTNPPYLARNSAKRRGLPFPDTKHDDLYKFALERMLDNASFVAAIIPDSFVTSGLFLDRVSRIISIHTKMFDDTDCPVCLSLFSPCNDPTIYRDDVLVGQLSDLRRHLPIARSHSQWRFNSPDGDIGLIAVDNTRANTIRFVQGSTIPRDSVKVSSRSITRIRGTGDYDLGHLLASANRILDRVRCDTYDVFLTAFKGVRLDGVYRRRLDFGLARHILDAAKEEVS